MPLAWRRDSRICSTTARGLSDSAEPPLATKAVSLAPAGVRGVSAAAIAIDCARSEDRNVGTSDGIACRGASAASCFSACSARALAAVASERAACSSTRMAARSACCSHSSRWLRARRTNERPTCRPSSSTALPSSDEKLRRSSSLRCDDASQSSSASSSSAASASKLLPPQRDSTSASMQARVTSSPALPIPSTGSDRFQFRQPDRIARAPGRAYHVGGQPRAPNIARPRKPQLFSLTQESLRAEGAARYKTGAL